VPYKPKHWLKVSTEGLKENDLVFVVGYPGRTQRYQTFNEVKETTDWGMPLSIRLAEEQIALLETITKDNRDLAIKAAARVRGLNNGLTNQKGMLEGLLKGGALGVKEKKEKALVDWIDADPARKAKYGEILPALHALQAEAEKTRERSSVLGGLAGASTYLASAQSLYRLAGERPKPDMERESGFRNVIGCGSRKARSEFSGHSMPLSTAASSVGPWPAPPHFPPSNGSLRSMPWPD
jgi:hypothetical protein